MPRPVRPVQLLVGAIVASTSLSCGCEIYQSTADGRGVAFVEAAPAEKTDLRLSYSTRYNEGFLDASGLGAFYMGIRLSESGGLRSPGFFFSVDLGPEVGSTQSGGEATATYPMMLVERMGVGAETGVIGFLEIDGVRVDFKTIEATTIDKTPPTFDVVLTGVDESNEIWKVELRVETGQSGRNPTCG